MVRTLSWPATMTSSESSPVVDEASDALASIGSEAPGISLGVTG